MPSVDSDLYYRYAEQHHKAHEGNDAEDDSAIHDEVYELMELRTSPTSIRQRNLGNRQGLGLKIAFMKPGSDTTSTTFC